MDVDHLLPDEPVSRDGTYSPRLQLDDNRVLDAAHLALREAHVQLLRDLWAKTEDVDRLVAERTQHLVDEIKKLRKANGNLRRDRCRAR